VLGSNSDTSLYSTEAETNSPSASSHSLNSEGGEVPIAQLVKTVGEAHPVVAAHSPTNNAAGQTNDSTGTVLAGAGISGELARAVAFEMIEGPGAPIAYAASRDGQQHLATQQASDTNTAESHAQTIAAAGSHSTTISAYLQLPLATTAARKAAANSVARPAMLHQGADLIRLAALVHAADQSFSFAAPWVAAADEFNEVAFDQASLDAARDNAFSQWGDVPDADLAEEQETHHGWLAATPFLAVLAAERYVSRKQKRAEAAAAAPAIKRS
jgi:hypothetical protein